MEDTKYTFEHLQKMRTPDIKNNTFIFDKLTTEFEFIDFLKNKNLKRIEFQTPQSQLRYLDASGCGLEEIVIADSVTTFESLQTIYLQNNALTKLNIVAKMPRLELMDISNNKITELPPIIGDCAKLRNLFLSENEIVVPPPEVVSSGLHSIKDYFIKIKEQGTEYLYESKMLILGHAKSGKTSLVRRIKDPKAELPEEYDRTRGIEVTKWNFPLPEPKGITKDYTVNIWDFGGQQIYHATHRFFLTIRSVYVLVIDASESKNQDCNYWFHLIEKFGDDSPVLIIINEKEGFTYRLDNYDKLRGRFPNIKEKLDVDIKINKGRESYLSSIKHLLNTLPETGVAIPKSWKTIRNRLNEIEENYISIERFYDICEEQKLDETSAKKLSLFLHKLGAILHFSENELLRKTIFLNPEWVTDAVYKILDDTDVTNNKGEFCRTDADTVWRDKQYRDVRGELLEMMKRFLLIYQIPDTYNYIVPQLLADDKPDYDVIAENYKTIKYKYEEFMPRGIIHQFIVLMHRYIQEQKFVWHKGVIINDKNTYAEVIEEYYDEKIEIRVSGEYPKEMIEKIIDTLDNINMSYNKKLKFDKWIPCNCNKCSTMKFPEEPEEYSFEVLRKFAKNKTDIQCRESGDMVSAESLIDTVIERHNLKDIQHQQKNESANQINVTINNTNMSEHSIQTPEIQEETTKILFLAANPTTEARIQTDKEYSDIDKRLKMATQRNKFELLHPQFSVTIDDLLQKMCEEPAIVHFAGHGEEEGIIIADDSNEGQLLPTDILEYLLEDYKNTTELIILSSCYSAQQAKAISTLGIDVIGMNKPVIDDASISFVTGVYIGLGEGQPIDRAFKAGKIKLRLNFRNESSIPELWKDGQKIDI